MEVGESKSMKRVRKMLKCDLCDFKTSDKRHFNRPNESHTGVGPFKCSVCNFATPYKRSHTIHEMNHHVPPVGHIVSNKRSPLKVGPNQIEQSESKLLKMEREGVLEQNPVDSVQTPLDFQSDFYTHPAEKQIVLKEKSHMKTDMDERSENSTGLLKLPEKSFIGVELKPGYGTTTVDGEPEKHGLHNDHNVKKVYKCPYCAFWVSTVSRFHTHIVSHLNKRPFQCSFCNYRCNWSWDVTRHIRLKSLRDPSHKNAKVFLIDETGIRNYAKYEKYLTTMHNQPTESSQKETQPNKQLPPQTDNEGPNFMCETCPFICQTWTELEAHAEKHFFHQIGTKFKCQFCKFFALDKEELMYHLGSHNENEAGENFDSTNVVFACLACPYVAASKAQLIYHRKGHSNESQHKCQKCTYNAPNYTILALHVRVHFSANADISGVDTSKLSGVPMVWVSEPMGIAKLFKCRFCPHTSMSKTNIKNHENMHLNQQMPNFLSQMHQCNECSYTCNNTEGLSSHIKVHLAYFGQVVGVVDPTRTDSEQIAEMKAKLNIKEEPKEDPQYFSPVQAAEDITNVEREKYDRILHFCSVCPARFLYARLMAIHACFHQLQLPFKCRSCSYTARLRTHLDAHLKVHSEEYQRRTDLLAEIYETAQENPRHKAM